MGEFGKEPTSSTSLSTENATPTDDWELIMETRHFRMWQRLSPGLEDQGLYEYYCSGSYTSISAKEFFIAQMDLEYRKKWDDYVLSLDVLERDERTGTELVRWFPMYPREYIFTRRWSVRPDRLVYISRDEGARDGKHVRVAHYRCAMVIRPHDDPDIPGLDFAMIYRANPISSIPNIAYKWMLQRGIPGFLDQVMTAAERQSPHDRERARRHYLPKVPPLTLEPDQRPSQPESPT